MSADALRSQRLEARISREGLAVVKRAAELQGRSLSDFVVSAAQEAAARAIEETTILRLSLEGQRAFAEAIANPPDTAPGFEKAISAHRRLVREVR